MIKIAIIGLVLIGFLCFAISGGYAWGALLFEVAGAFWLMYCFNRYSE